MPVIYFDNFRGFKKTFLPLKNVNFFVGENSSGKTSVLKLIKFFSDNSYVFSQEFNFEDAELGYFTEIASNSEKSINYFEIGLLDELPINEYGIKAIKLRFINKEGVPFLNKMSLINYDINIQATIKNGQVKYRFSIINLKSITESTKLDYFKYWIENNTLKGIPYQITKIQYSKLSYNLVWEINTIINRIKEEDNKLVEKRYLHRNPTFFPEVVWFAPIRTDPKRTYDSYKTNYNPDGTHTPYLLKKLLGKDSSKQTKQKVESLLQNFGKESGLFDNIIINLLGQNDTSPFELQVLINNQPLKITNVGYGVSQILPLIIEIISRRSNTWYAIQQPEIHLHPRGQAAFGDFIFNVIIYDHKNFIIETHSDYIIDRFRLNVNKYKSIDEANNIKSQIVFFNRIQGLNELTCIPIMEDGSLPDNQPKEFRDFFIKEQLDLLQM